MAPTVDADIALAPALAKLPVAERGTSLDSVDKAPSTDKDSIDLKDKAEDFNTETASTDEYDWSSPEFANIPELVRNVVSSVSLTQALESNPTDT